MRRIVVITLLLCLLPSSNTQAAPIDALVALNNLEVKSEDIRNACLDYPIKEKIWTTLGPEFGSDQRKKAIIVRDLCGLKHAGAAFRCHLADCMGQLRHSSCLADPDAWLKPQCREDSFKHNACVLICADDIIEIHHDAASCINDINECFPMKPD